MEWAAPSLGMGAWFTGRLIGLRDQIGIKQLTDKNLSKLYNHLTGWLGTGAVGMLLMMVWVDANWAAWLGIILYGYGNGPCVGCANM